MALRMRDAEIFMNGKKWGKGVGGGGHKGNVRPDLGDMNEPPRRLWCHCCFI